MQLKPQSIGDIYLFSEGLSPADYSLTGVHVIDSIEDAVLASVARSGDPAVAVIPEGPYIVPTYKALAA